MLKYLPYIAISAFVDQSDELRLGRCSLSERHEIDTKAFARTSRKYRSELERRANLQRYSKSANTKTVSHESRPRQSKSTDTLNCEREISVTHADMLYRVSSWDAFGHTDGWMMTIASGFDAAFTIVQKS
ncbi:MAG: hypothetical protein AAFP90_15970, partial [Planctomycetota bacterium]